MSAPLVTCVVPVYNGERFLAQSLDSILAQTYRPTEIVVVDDGSTDGTHNVVRSYGDSIRYIRQDNQGASTARNHGISVARGELVAFLDADDLWTPNKLDAQWKALEPRHDLGYVVCLAQNFWMDEVSSEADQYRDHARSRPIAAYVSQALLARASAFDVVGPLNSQLKHADSMDWFIRAKEAGVEGLLLEEVLLLRRMHGKNLSRERAGSSLDEFFGLLKGSLDRRR